MYITVPLLERGGEEASRGAAAADGGAGDDADGDADSDVGPRYFNTVCLAAPTGELVAHYRKLTPWPRPEKSWATPGDRGVQTYDTEYGRVGLAICFDIHTILEKYEGHDLWALLYPIAWVYEEHPADWFWRRLPERLAPFDFYVIGANWSVDEPQKWRGYGFSTIYAPGGKVVESATSLYGSEIVYATIPTAWHKSPHAESAALPIAENSSPD